MKKVVLDTNVFIAALYSQLGASFRLLEIAGKEFEFCISVPLILEYEAVAKRMAQELGLSHRDIDDAIDYICSVGIATKIYYLWRPVLKDPKDDMMLELAVGAKAGIIVTHNVKDFAATKMFGIEAMEPKKFLKLLKEKS